MPKPDKADKPDRRTKPPKVKDAVKHGGWRNVAGVVGRLGLITGDPDYVTFASQGEAVSWVNHGLGFIDLTSVPAGAEVVPLPKGFEFPDDEAPDVPDDPRSIPGVV